MSNEGRQQVTPKTSPATPTSAPTKSGKERELDHFAEPRDGTDDEEAE